MEIFNSEWRTAGCYYYLSAYINKNESKSKYSSQQPQSSRLSRNQCDWTCRLKSEPPSSLSFSQTGFSLSFSGGFLCLLNKLTIRCTLPLSLCVCAALRLPQMGTRSFRLKERETAVRPFTCLDWTCLEFLSALKCHHLFVCVCVYVSCLCMDVVYVLLWSGWVCVCF